jgi:hypothetical protein
MSGLKYALAMLGVGGAAAGVATEADASTIVNLNISAFDAPQNISLEGGPAQFYYGAGTAKVGIGSYAPAAIFGVNAGADASLAALDLAPGLPGPADAFGYTSIKIGTIAPADPSDPTSTPTLTRFPVGIDADAYVRLTFNADSTQYVGTARFDRAGTLKTIEYANAAVPEPAAWALMIGGFGLAGAAIRNRRRQALAAQ